MTHIFFKTAWGYIRRSPFQALAAIFVLSITFFVTTIMATLVYSSEQTLKYYETQPQVIAFLKDEAALEEISALQDKLMIDPRLKDVRYVSKEEALEIYKRVTANKPLLSELVSPSIFPASIEFSLVDLSYLEQTIDELGKETIIDEVGYTASLPGETSHSEVVNNLRTITRYLRIGGAGFVALQLTSSFLVLIVIIMMRLSFRKKEIEILDLIGATPSFIRNPIILEALFYSLAGVFLGWLSALILILYSTPSILTYFRDIPVLPKDTLNLISIFVLILAAELFIGLVLALAGSTVAVSRARKKHR